MRETRKVLRSPSRRGRVDEPSHVRVAAVEVAFIRRSRSDGRRACAVMAKAGNAVLARVERSILRAEIL